MNRGARHGVIPVEEFLRAWSACETPAQVDRRLGLSKGASARRVQQMRSAGIDVPRQEVTP